MTPLGGGQHFCLGLVKFMELVHQIHLAEEGPTQTRANCENECDVNKTCGGRRDIHRLFGFFLLSNVGAVLLTCFDSWQS